MNPWTIIGWLILAGLTGLALSAIGYFVAGEIKQIKLSLKFKKAHAGKLVCEEFNCNEIAEVRTQSGFFCRKDGRNSGRFSSFSFAIPLDYLKEK